MKNGFLYEITDVLIRSQNYLNLVQLIKHIAKKLSIGSSADEQMKNANIAIDIFIIAKWLFIIYLWVDHVNGTFTTFVVYYLIWSSFQTYFYYHLWKDNIITTSDRSKRRLINLIQTLFFINVTFGYLYSVVYTGDFALSEIYFNNHDLAALIYSFSRSLFIDGNSITPQTPIAEFLSLAQSYISFIYVVVLLSKSLPNDKLAPIKRRRSGIQK